MSRSPRKESARTPSPSHWHESVGRLSYGPGIRLVLLVEQDIAEFYYSLPKPHVRNGLTSHRLPSTLLDVGRAWAEVHDEAFGLRGLVAASGDDRAPCGVEVEKEEL